MGPLAGGLLATQSKVLQRIFSPLDQVTGALRYVLCDPGVSSVASGMTSVEEVEENCEIVDALPENLSLDFQKKADARIKEELGSGIVTFESLLCGECEKSVLKVSVFRSTWNESETTSQPETSRRPQSEISVVSHHN